MAQQKLNCWQFKNCGRESGGLLADLLGACPVAQAGKYDGENGGIAAGRVCWKVPGACLRCEGTLSGQGKPCHECAFYKRVHYEEADTGVPTQITEIPNPVPAKVEQSTA